MIERYNLYTINTRSRYIREKLTSKWYDSSLESEFRPSFAREFLYAIHARYTKRTHFSCHSLSFANSCQIFSNNSNNLPISCLNSILDKQE